MRSNVNSRGSRFWVNLRQYCLRRATDCAKPASGSVPLAEVGELAWRQFWPDMASVMWYWLEMSWESSCVCVCGRTRLSCPFLSVSGLLLYSASLWSAFVLFSGLASTGAPSHWVLSVRHRASGCYNSDITTREGVWNVDLTAKGLHWYVIHILQVVTRSKVSTLFYENE